MNMLRPTQLVNIPKDKGIHIKPAGKKKEKYVYKYVSYYRNENKEPRNKAKSIGKFDEATGKLIPNKNYFEMYKVHDLLLNVLIWNYGYTYLIEKISKDIGLFDCLVAGFGEERSVELLTLSAYVIRQGNIMDGVCDWQEKQFNPHLKHKLTSQRCSDIIGNISEDMKQEFFIKWINVSLTKGGVFYYDVTSFSSHSNEMTDIERGYNRDKEKLNQSNMGMFCDETTRLPVYYERYNGSLTDKTNLPYTMENARRLGIKNIKLILDGGFFDKKCLKSIKKYCDSFTVGMPTHLKEAKLILNEHREGIDSYTYEIDKHTYAKSIDITMFGMSGRIIVFYDALNRVFLCDDLSAYIERLVDELESLKKYPASKLSRYKPYFTLTKHEDGVGFDYVLDFDKVEDARKNKGFFLLFTTDMISSPADLLYYYRAKDADEKIFSQIKTDLGNRRFRTHNKNTTDGKSFLMFISCILRTYLLKQLSPYLSARSMSLTKALNQLDNIMIIEDDGIKRFTKALTKKQKDILSFFDADKKILDSL